MEFKPTTAFKHAFVFAISAGLATAASAADMATSSPSPAMSSSMSSTSTTETTATSDSKADYATVDQRVLSKIHHGNQMEIDLSKLALTKTQANGVKEFANHIIEDHGAADLEVKMVAKKEHLKLQSPLVPANDTEKQSADADKAEHQKLKGLSGPAFDAEFEKAMAEGHQKTITELEGVLPKTGKHTHALIEKLLPHFKDHLKMVEQLQTATK